MPRKFNTPNNSDTSSQRPTHEEIAAQAYEIWRREGSIDGRDQDHWLQAEAELLSKRQNGVTSNGKSQSQRQPDLAGR